MDRLTFTIKDAINSSENKAAAKRTYGIKRSEGD